MSPASKTICCAFNLISSCKIKFTCCSQKCKRETVEETSKEIKFNAHIRNKHEITPDGRVAYEDFRMYTYNRHIMFENNSLNYHAINLKKYLACVCADLIK